MVSESVEQPTLQRGITLALGERQPSLEVRTRCGKFAKVHFRGAEVIERIGGAPGMVDLLVQDERLFEQVLSAGKVPPHRFQPARVHGHGGPRGGTGFLAPRERLAQPGAPLVDAAVVAPVRAHCGGEASQALPIPRFGKPGARKANVVNVLVEPRQPARVLEPLELLLRGLRKLDAVVGVPIADCRRFARGQLGKGELADGLEDAESRLSIMADRCDHQVVVDEYAKRFEERILGIAIEATARAPSRPKPPLNTAQRANSSRSRGGRSS